MTFSYSFHIRKNIVNSTFHRFQQHEPKVNRKRNSNCMSKDLSELSANRKTQCSFLRIGKGNMSDCTKMDVVFWRKKYEMDSTRFELISCTITVPALGVLYYANYCSLQLSLCLFCRLGYMFFIFVVAIEDKTVEIVQDERLGKQWFYVVKCSDEYENRSCRLIDHEQ